jgi:hypothetical protein
MATAPIRIEFDRDCWEQGIRDGAQARTPPAWSRGLRSPGKDSYAYNSGYIEGSAYRDGFEVSVDVARIARQTE